MKSVHEILTDVQRLKGLMLWLGSCVILQFSVIIKFDRTSVYKFDLIWHSIKGKANTIQKIFFNLHFHRSEVSSNDYFLTFITLKTSQF